MLSSAVLATLSLQVGNTMANTGHGCVGLICRLVLLLTPLHHLLVLLPQQPQLFLHHLHCNLSFKYLSLLPAVVTLLHLRQVLPPDNEIPVAFVLRLQLGELLFLLLRQLELAVITTT